MSNSGLTSSSSLIFDYGPEIHRPASVYDGLLIDDGDFRLLQIEPADNSATQIVARLFTASLRNPPPYEAVSYRWEQTNESHFIMVNNTKFPVMRNVFSLLSEFRCQSYPSSPIVWVDSICINQSCINDRNSQVQLMGRIYSEASVVRMWIGTESDLDNQAFELIRDCGPPGQKLVGLVARKFIRNEAGTKAVTRLLQRDYWNRMWVFQEIVLARKAVVHCGKLQAPWSYFRWLDEVSAKHTILWLSAQIKEPWIFDFRKALFRIAHFCITPVEARYINNVIHPTRHLQCQDPRDKVFALRGVCAPLEGMIRVDYSVSVRDVFTTFAREQILWDSNMSVLLTAGLWNPVNGDDINLPSWVPDLRGMGDVDLRYLAGHHMNSFDADAGAKLDHKLKILVRAPDFKQDGISVLNVHAMSFDFVQKHKPLQGIASSGNDRKQMIKAFCLLAETGRLSMRRLRQLFEGLIFADKTTLMSDRQISERARRLALGFYEDLCQLFGPDPVFIEFLECFLGDTPDSQGNKSLRAEAQLCGPDHLRLCCMEYLGRAAETTDRQATALFTSVDGHLGIGPRRVQQGDVIFIVEGCRVPMALRPYGSYYKVVGPAYVSGIMQGEIVSSDGRDEHANFQSIQLV